MSLTKFPFFAIPAICLALSAGASAAGFPERPIRFVVPFAAGTATDQLARALGQAITLETKQQVIVDNRPGGNGFIGANEAARAAPDGYTVLIATNTTHAAAEHLYKRVPYDPVKSFAPITALGKGGQIMVVNANSPVTNVGDFIARAKKEPGKLTFGSGSSSSRVAGELFQQMAGVQLLHVPYKSNTYAITDLMGGQIGMMITDTATGLPHIKSGKLRALGYSGSTRSPLAPTVPTIAEAGVKGYDIGYWFAAYAPAKTPAPIVARLNDLLRRAANSPTANSGFYAMSGTTVFLTSPQELAAFQAAEAKRWGEIIRKAGIEKE
ncbi:MULTISPECIES: tripartite tricarboxylate transporter substrate binding protein [unclassified Massilia]|uniref:Bug family tripartite tricarboxylate transporter substrate binding protein n=1 Tax=unclassified Massilia TaxID=2609279 RepID=UPI00177EB634|nr:MULTISPECIES: tripartite tricarboxylate transporter substrate binding protein [unclassified Massilia]MBD8529291.1 tripartite tricarboxylate transporter substrate binding protein [Massilia sp. CFBP 13647]MBD8672685.1 tripartite tricarboxylate transporter substrate binding protein [Massilia sp. CFBP 13721]